jgi:hypothetical protein
MDTDMHDGDKNAYRILVGKLERKRQLRQHEGSWKCNIMIDFKDNV